MTMGTPRVISYRGDRGHTDTYAVVDRPIGGAVMGYPGERRTPNPRALLLGVEDLGAKEFCDLRL